MIFYRYALQRAKEVKRNVTQSRVNPNIGSALFDTRTAVISTERKGRRNGCDVTATVQLESVSSAPDVICSFALVEIGHMVTYTMSYS